ncbi:MAG: hypothetical protein AAF958_20035, partial [Planctomycetota bacterium]
YCSGRKSFGFDAVTEKLFGKIPKYERTFLNSRSLPSLPNSDSVRQASIGVCAPEDYSTTLFDSTTLLGAN